LSIEILCTYSFASCASLKSISFESPSHLKRLGFYAFNKLPCPIVLPCTVLFVNYDLGIDADRLSFQEGDSFRDCQGWLRVRNSDIAIDFRRILKIDFDLPEFTHCPFEIISESTEIEPEISRGLDDCSMIVVKSISRSDSMEDSVIKQNIMKLINLSHPCIIAPIWFTVPIGSPELKLWQLYSKSPSLAEVLSDNPAWWTPTAKAKAVVGLVLGLRFAHSFGLIHGHLTTKNIVFDLDHRIQITDFLCGLSEQDICGFSDERWSPKADVCGFSSLLSAIVIGRPANEERFIPVDVPNFVSEMIKMDVWPESKKLPSFRDIFAILKSNNFRIMAEVDSKAVSTFVNWVEFFEQEND
jgi:hypothetical protein